MQSYKFKIVLLGEGRVGKTSILRRYIEGKFSDKEESTFQAHYLEKRINLGSKAVTLSIWDTAGQERFHALAPIYYRDANGAILVYDITDRTSFGKVQHWVEELRKIVGFDIILMVAANKEDLNNRRQVEMNEASSYANKVGAKVIGTSAKTGMGIEEVFLELTKSLLQQQSQNQRSNRNSGTRGPKTNIAVIDDTQFDKKNNNCACNLI